MVLASGEGNGATGNGVVLGGGVVDVDQQTGLLAGVDAGELDDGRGGLGGGTGNGDLSAGNVELGTTLGAGAVEANVLSAHQVLAGGDLLGESEGEVVDTSVVDVGGPLETSLGDVGGGKLVNLEPVAVTLVGGDAGGSLGEVDGEGTGVAHVVLDDEADLVTGVDGLGLGLCEDVVVVAANVADDAVGGNVGDGGVGVLGLADVLVALGLLTVDDESREDVVGHGLGHDGRGGEESEGAHLDFCVVLVLVGEDRLERSDRKKMKRLIFHQGMNESEVSKRKKVVCTMTKDTAMVENEERIEKRGK